MEEPKAERYLAGVCVFADTEGRVVIALGLPDSKVATLLQSPEQAIYFADCLRKAAIVAKASSQPPSDTIQ